MKKDRNFSIFSPVLELMMQLAYLQISSICLEEEIL